MYYVTMTWKVDRSPNRHLCDVGDEKTYPSVNGWRVSMNRYLNDPETVEHEARNISAVHDLYHAGRSAYAALWHPGAERGCECRDCVARARLQQAFDKYNGSDR